MKAIKIIGTALMIAVCSTTNVNAQQETETIVKYDSVVSYKGFEKEADVFPKAAVKVVNAHWCALGTSITHLNNHDKRGRFERGYLDRTMDQIRFAKMTNQGVSGGCINSAIDKVVPADYYTIEHGINDWGSGVEPGTMDDYIYGTRPETFAGGYRKVIDKIFEINPKAKVVLCTPRKGYDFMTYLPKNCMDRHKGHYLKDYVNIIRQIGEYEGFPVADFYAECGGQRDLRNMSMDSALHPNDRGHQMMANVLVKAIEKVLQYDTYKKK